MQPFICSSNKLKSYSIYLESYCEAGFTDRQAIMMIVEQMKSAGESDGNKEDE